jgi:hypothetical protein
VPDWAFRPAPPELGLAVQHVKGQLKVKVESKQWAAQCAALNSNVEVFINSGSEIPQGNADRVFFFRIVAFLIML